MNFKFKYLFGACILAGALTLSACSDDDGGNSEVAVGVKISSQVKEDLTITGGTYTFKNVSTGLETTVDYAQKKVVLVDGLYHVSFTGTAVYDYDPTAEKPQAKAALVFNVAVQGVQQNVTIKGGQCELNLELHVRYLNEKGDFVIAEIFPSGTLNETTNKQYNGDQYFRIYNNSDETLYADGLVIMESAFMTVRKMKYTPDIMDKAVTVQVVAMIPGSGKEYPVEPGKSIVICDNALNHKEANPSSADLSKADFEWFTNSTSTSIVDADNPNVPNLNMLYNYTRTIWVLNKQANKAYLIGRLPKEISPEEYLEKYTYTYKFELATGTISRDITDYYFPNEWIIDAVNLSPKNDYVWNVTSSTLDMGFAYIGLNTTIAENAGKAVVRKVEKTVNGRVVLKDTNNSTEDFECAVSATLLSK
ncbi:MAG: DUF4876 domain-containing protein [Bacteroidia bacterium]|nr:DUF4876 domain-containing protein [Bacteroidia bacterium]